MKPGISGRKAAICILPHPGAQRTHPGGTTCPTRWHHACHRGGQRVPPGRTTRAIRWRNASHPVGPCVLPSRAMRSTRMRTVPTPVPRPRSLPPARPLSRHPTGMPAARPPFPLSNSEKPTRPAFPATRLAEILLAAPIQPACQPPRSPSYEPISHYATSVHPKASEMAAGASGMLSLHIPHAQREYSRGQRSLPGACSPPSTPPVGLHQALHAGSQRSGHHRLHSRYAGTRYAGLRNTQHQWRLPK